MTNRLNFFISLVFVSLLTANSALAQTTEEATENPNPYSFGGGACTSQGVWTRSALESTHHLMRIINDLKDDKNCRGLRENLQALSQQTEASIAYYNAGGTPNVSRLTELPNEIGALTSAISSDAALKNFGLPLLAKKNIENAALMAEYGAATTLPMGAHPQLGGGFGSANGLALVQTITERMPDLDRCMVNSEKNTAMLLGGAVQLLSSYIASGTGISAQVARTLESLATTMRNRRYTQILRKLQTSDFWTSMSCLIETTSEAYCSVRDMHKIFDSGIQGLQGKVIEGKIQGFDDPFKGFYILVTEVPIITSWLQKIQIGVDPRLDSDANFQATILDTINQHLKKIKFLQGTYNKLLETLRRNYSANDTLGKQVAVLDMIQNLVGIMAPGSVDTSASGQLKNFFTSSHTSALIPFLLIGKESIPPGVTGGDVMQQIATREWADWMQNGGKFKDRPEFDNPEELAVEIGVNMKRLIDEANVLAINYFNQWFIVDKPTLVSESVLDQGYSVTESLQHLINYLDGLQTRIETLDGSRVLIPELIETRERIRTVLAAYEPIVELSKHPPKTPEEMAKYLVDAPQAYQNVVETVYVQFNVMLQRAGFISNRMRMFVEKDYAMMVRKDPNLSQYEREIYIASGVSLADRLIQLYSMNSAGVRADLDNASTINRRAIFAIEQLTRDSLVPIIAEMKMIAQGQNPTSTTLTAFSLKQIIHDTWSKHHIPGGAPTELEDQTQFAKDHPGRGWMMSYIPGYKLLTSWWYPVWFHPDRYPLMMSNVNDPRGLDDEFGSTRQVYSRLCVQTLAFEDWMLYADLCDGARLLSPFNPAIVQQLQGKYFPKSLSLNGYVLDSDYNAKSREGLDANKSMESQKRNASARICAFRDYNRRNLIVQLILQELKNRL